MTKPVQHPLAFCPVHGVFAATAFALGPGSSSTFVGSKTDCPRCGGVSEIIPGRYEAEAERLNVLLDHSSISPEALAAIKELALKLQKGTITPDEAVKEAEKISPAAAGLFAFLRWDNPGARATYIGAIICVAGQLLAARCTPPPVVNVQPVIERVLPKDDAPTTGSMSATAEVVPLPKDDAPTWDRPFAKVPLPRPRPRPRPKRY